MSIRDIWQWLIDADLTLVLWVAGPLIVLMTAATILRKIEKKRAKAQK